jgi:hypothetical protein
METLDQLDWERRQLEPPKRSPLAKLLRRTSTIRALVALGLLLTKFVQLGIEIYRTLRE